MTHVETLRSVGLKLRLSGAYREESMLIESATTALAEELRIAREELAKHAQLMKVIGRITSCAICGGSGRASNGGACCRIPGHAKECKCALCQWKNAYYRETIALCKERDEAIAG